MSPRILKFILWTSKKLNSEYNMKYSCYVKKNNALVQSISEAHVVLIGTVEI